MADKGGFPHYMLKEIFDQPQGLRDTIAPRVSLEDAWFGSTTSASARMNCAPCAASTSWPPAPAATPAWPAST